MARRDYFVVALSREPKVFKVRSDSRTKARFEVSEKKNYLLDNLFAFTDKTFQLFCDIVERLSRCKKLSRYIIMIVNFNRVAIEVKETNKVNEVYYDYTGDNILVLTRDRLKKVASVSRRYEYLRNEFKK